MASMKARPAPSASLAHVAKNTLESVKPRKSAVVDILTPGAKTKVKHTQNQSNKYNGIEGLGKLSCFDFILIVLILMYIFFAFNKNSKGKKDVYS